MDGGSWGWVEKGGVRGRRREGGEADEEAAEWEGEVRGEEVLEDEVRLWL